MTPDCTQLSLKADASAPADACPVSAILFVDDEPNILSAFERQLRGKFDITTAVGAAEALRTIEMGRQFAVVISDLRMPEMDGFQLLDRVRSLLPDAARLILTGYADVPTVIQAVNSGSVLRFLQKPCSREALQGGVLAGLSHHEWLVAERRMAHEAWLRHTNQLVEMHREVDTARQVVVRVEATLAQSDSRFRATFGAAPIGLCLLSADERIVESNHSIQMIFRSGGKALQGQKLADYVHGEDRRQLQEHFSTLVKGARERCQFVIRENNGDGRVGRLRVTMCRPPIPNPDFVVIAMVEDITEQLHLQEQLLRAQKMQALSRLAAGISNDFNNLFTTIRGNIDLASQLWPEVDENLCDARQAVDRATTLVRQLFFFGRETSIEPEVLDLDNVVAELESVMRHLTGRAVELKMHLGAGGACILGDRTQIEQVLMNLALNARDAMPSGGTLELRVEVVSVCDQLGNAPGVPPGDCVMLSVADTGVGMSPEVRSLIFEPFFTTKTPKGGAGLGLSTVYGIVQRYHGHITVDSQVGEGSTFRIYFPLVESSGATAGNQEDSPAAHVPTVLVAEDDNLVRTLICRILTEEGYRVLAAESGERACDMLRRDNTRIVLLLTNVTMPGMSGEELARRIKLAQSQSKVIFVSGHYVLESCDGPCLSKPFSPAELLKLVRSVLGQNTAESSPALAEPRIDQRLG